MSFIADVFESSNKFQYSLFFFLTCKAKFHALQILIRSSALCNTKAFEMSGGSNACCLVYNFAQKVFFPDFT